MLCQKCHKNLASVRYAEVVDGRVNNLHLCKDCLDKQQTETETGFELTAPAPLVNRDLPSASTFSDASAAIETCTACETSLKTVVERAKVGCMSCYETFPAQIESLLEGLQHALTHRGKVPHVDDTRARVRTDLQSKRALLKTALSMENYEEAAHLRDNIRALESGLGASEAGAD